MGAKHQSARQFMGNGLFNELTNFNQLEKRISSLPSMQDIGNAFEVFAEAYLATQKISQAKEVWPEKGLLPTLRKHLSLPDDDMGVDGVLETTLSEYHAYQVKFRTGRSALAWRELSTFVGLTDSPNISQRIIFTNCDDVSAVIDKRQNVVFIRGNDLERLGPKDFEIISAWIKGSFIEVKKKEPLPHQREALDVILYKFKKHDRQLSVMACGSGKTLVALWVAEKIGAKTILVLVPSLALVRQTLHEWLKETTYNDLPYLCVCSEQNVDKGADDFVVRQSDLDFTVTSEPKKLRDFLSHNFSGARVVFATYQSAKVVAEGMKGLPPFDLAIFDEAHKTAGRKGALFGFALDDNNLQARKRLFLTATPRHYDVSKKNKEGELKVVYSMDSPEVYGPISYKLTFAEAAQKKIICNYKIIISAVTSEMVNDEILRRGEVIVDGDLVKARQVANQIALQKAIDCYGVHRIFTFHQSVKSAQSFTGQGGEGIRAHLPNFWTGHVRGTMPTAERESHMKEFSLATRAIMSNARCLTEGVDVPAVDMVAFLSPKKSKVDIVQATGRAMRKSDLKTVGYVLIPLFLNVPKGETVEEALERTDFEEVAYVLQAMQEQDDILVDIIQQMRMEKGRTGGYDDSRFREKVDFLGPELTLKNLQMCITAVCIEKLGTTWDERYGQLLEYKYRFGHCNVPKRFIENKKLAGWVANQRVSKIKGVLEPSRVCKLNDIDFSWNTIDSTWEDQYAALAAYKTKHGNCEIPSKYEENQSLSLWVITQRYFRKKGKLSQERISKLNGLDFIWNKPLKSWKRWYLMLVEYQKLNGHCNVPQLYPENMKLGRWVNSLRLFQKDGNLSAEQIKQLDEIGFS